METWRCLYSQKNYLQLDKEVREKYFKDEPDVYVATNVYGQTLVIQRNRVGVLCGYVNVSDEVERDHVEYAVEVHGGITYFGKLGDSKQNYAGFDCAHYGDIMPVDYFTPDKDAVYRTFSYVLNECDSLAKQLRELK